MKIFWGRRVRVAEPAGLPEGNGAPALAGLPLRELLAL